MGVRGGALGTLPLSTYLIVSYPPRKMELDLRFHCVTIAGSTSGGDWERVDLIRAADVCQCVPPRLAREMRLRRGSEGPFLICC